MATRRSSMAQGMHKVSFAGSVFTDGESERESLCHRRQSEYRPFYQIASDGENGVGVCSSNGVAALESGVHSAPPPPPYGRMESVGDVSSCGRPSVGRGMGWCLGTLRLFGLFPMSQSEDEPRGSSLSGDGQRGLRFRRKGLPALGWLALGLLFTLLSAAVLAFNLFIVSITHKHLGLLAPDTMANILTGLKPAQTTGNLLIFLTAANKHRHFLYRLEEVNKSFYYRFRMVAPWGTASRAFVVGVSSVCLATLGLRIVQYILMGMSPGMSVFVDFSVVLVPVLSGWQLIPLFYFVFCTRILRFYFHSLKKALLKDSHLEKRSLEVYYKHFLQLCSCCQALREFFDGFILFSLSMSVTILCLTIYFVTNADAVLKDTADSESSRELQVAMVFIPVWAGLQILTALLYTASMLFTGIKTNEVRPPSASEVLCEDGLGHLKECRGILPVVLALVPEDDVGRFLLMSFSQKIQVQHLWGISVWNAFPVERGLFFTVLLMSNDTDCGTASRCSW